MMRSSRAVPSRQVIAISVSECFVYLTRDEKQNKAKTKTTRMNVYVHYVHAMRAGSVASEELRRGRGARWKNRRKRGVVLMQRLDCN